MTHFRLIWVGLLFTLWPFASNAWISSGGEIFRDAHNPWFVKNTTVVRYCVRVDQESISIPAIEVEKNIADAIQYWQTELAKPLLDPPFSNVYVGRIAVGTQSFEKVSCDHPAIDLRFLVGYGTLDYGITDPKEMKEKEFLKDTTRFVGVTVRQEYKEDLRAEGFIYISSDQGPYRYSPGNPNVLDQAWKTPRVLKLALIHELGHIFGFSHKGTGVMSEIFLEQLVNVGFGTLVSTGPMPSVLTPNLDLEDCDLQPLDLKFLGQKVHSIKCVYLQFNTSLPGLVGSGAEIEIFGSKEPASEKFKIGVLKRVTLSPSDMRMDPAVFLHPVANQTVFSEQELGKLPYMLGPVFQEFGGEALFVPADSALGARMAYFNVGPSFFRLYGQTDNRLRPVFESSSIYGFDLVVHP